MFFKKEVNKSNATKQMRTEKTGSKETHGGRGGRKEFSNQKKGVWKLTEIGC